MSLEQYERVCKAEFQNIKEEIKTGNNVLFSKMDKLHAKLFEGNGEEAWSVQLAKLNETQDRIEKRHKVLWGVVAFIAGGVVVELIFPIIVNAVSTAQP